MKAIVGLLIAATLAVGSGCAKTDWIDRTLVTEDVRGSWSGFWAEGRQGAGATVVLLFELEQRGSTVKGFMRFTAGSSAAAAQGLRPGPIEGTVAGDVFRFKHTDGSLEAQMTVSGDEMNGRITSFGMRGSGSLALRRVDSSREGAHAPESH
jgi:hypothetical protein